MKHPEKRRVVSGVLRGFAVFLSALFFVSGFRVPASAVTEVDLTGEGTGFTSFLYDNQTGLPTSEANCITQTGEGLIWIGAYSGLIRYDGNEFYRYSSTTGIASVVSLFTDSKDRLWVGTNDSGIALYENDEFIFYDKAEGLRSSSVRSIAEDPDGNILVATTKGMYYIDPAEMKLHPIDNPQINNEYICELILGEDGIVYGVTNSGAILTVENLKVAFYGADALGVNDVYTVYPDPENPGYVFIGSQQSEIYYGSLSGREAGYQTLTATGMNIIKCIRMFDGYLWVSTDKGIGFFNEDRTEFIEVKDLPMTNSIDHILRDYEENLWFTSSRQGVMKIVENRFTDISNQAKLSALVVNSTCLHDGKLYIAADTGLTVLDEDKKVVENAATEFLKGTRIRCVKEDRNGILWFCTYNANGLISYDSGKDEVKSLSVDDGMASNKVRMLKELADGTLAVATNAGLNLVKDGAVTGHYGKDEGISNLEILCVEEGAGGVLYLGSDGDGIYRIDGPKMERIGSDDGLKSEVILRITKDPFEEIFWIITSNSIAYMKDDQVTTVREFPYSNNFDMYFDATGLVWVLSSNGVYVVKRADLIANGKIDFTLYDTKSGLPGITTANSYSYLAEDGTLYIAMSTGVASVNILEDASTDSTIRLAVPFVTVDGKNIWLNGEKEVRLSPTARRLSIYGNAFTNSLNNPHLSYILEGFDSEPVYLTKKDMTPPTYTNLHGGTYRFILSLIDDVTGEVLETVTLTVIKEKAIHEQWWFYAILGLLGAAVIVATLMLLYRRKMKKLEKKQAENKALIDQMTKVFSSCIDMKDAYTNGHSARVAKYTKMLAEKLGKSPEEVEQFYNIALLHDIGKISIPDNILNKPGRLDDDEYKVMKTHSPRGYDILKDIQIAPGIALGAGYHHERYDGNGYPSGLKGDEIPEIAQIIAVADTFDAMYSTRPYRKQLPLEQVVAEIQRVKGTQLSPHVVDAFMKLVEEGAFDVPPCPEPEEKPEEKKE